MSVTVELSAARVADAYRVRVGEAFTLRVRGAESGCTIDLGDGQPAIGYPLDNGLAYTRPGRHVLRVQAPGFDPVPVPVEVEGAWPVEVHSHRLLASSTQGGLVTDNTVGCTFGGGPDDLVFYFAAGALESQVLRIQGTRADPFAGQDVHWAPVLGNPYHTDKYLMAGPAHRDAESGLTIMLALSGAAAQGLNYGAVELLWSDDDGRTFRYGGTALRSPVSPEVWRQDPLAYGGYACGGTSLLWVADADGDGADYLYAFPNEVAGKVVGPEGSAANWNPCGLARAPLRPLVEALVAGRPIAGLWRKWHNGAWSSDGVSGWSDVLTRCGGTGANQVVWCEDRFLMLAQPFDATGQSAHYLLWSHDLKGPWSLPQRLFLEQRPGWCAGAISVITPNSMVGRTFDVWYEPWNHSGDGEIELRAYTVALD